MFFKKKNTNSLDGIIEENALVDSSVDAFKKLLSMLGDTFKQKETDKPKSLKKDTYVGPKGVLGSEWKSCKAWRSKGGLSSFTENVHVDKSSNQFKISYTGPASGLSIAHAGNGKDTIHQLFNILICEINPILYEGNLKPNIDNIKKENELLKNELSLIKNQTVINNTQNTTNNTQNVNTQNNVVNIILNG